jgi:proteic killer suppression protein
MWIIYEKNGLDKILQKMPEEILKRYEKWKDVVKFSGPAGLRLIKGFHDESLKGGWSGYRSSRLGMKYRVIYSVQKEKLYVKVVEITPHDYRRK